MADSPPAQRSKAAYARPGDTVQFRCEDCAEIYRQTVQPRRNVARAIKRLREGDQQEAHDLLEEALADLHSIADYLNERHGNG